MADAVERPAPGAWRTVAVLFALSSISMADRHVISILAGPIKADLRLGDFELSLLMGAAFALFYIVASYPFGWLCDRWPRRWVMFWAVLLWSLAAMGSGLAGGFAALFVMRALVGVGEAGLGPAGHSLLAANFPRGRLSLPIAIQSFGIPFGAGLGVFGAGFVLAKAPGWSFAGVPLLDGMAPWQLAFVFVGLPGLLFALLALTIREPGRAGKGVAPAAPIAPYLRANWRVLAAFAVGIGVAAMAVQNLSTWTPEYLRREFGTDPLTIGAKMGGIALLASVLGQLGSGAIVDRLTRRGMEHAPLRFYRVLLCALLPLAVLAFLAESENLYLLGLFAMMLTLTPALSLGAAAMQLLAPPPLRARLAASYGIVITFVAFAVGPSLVGWLSQFVFGEDRLGTALGVSVVLCGVAGLILLTLALRGLARMEPQ